MVAEKIVAEARELLVSKREEFLAIADQVANAEAALQHAQGVEWIIVDVVEFEVQHGNYVLTVQYDCIDDTVEPELKLLNVHEGSAKPLPIFNFMDGTPDSAAIDEF